MSRAWMPMYWADYAADTRHLSRDEHGGYMLLIAHYWHTGSLPDDDERLARITLCRTECEWHALRKALKPFFEDGWVHKRIEAELSKSDEAYKKRALASEKAHAARWGKNANGSANRMPMACQSQSQSQLDTDVSNNNTSGRSATAELFEQFYQSYPKRKNRKAAEARFATAIRNRVNPSDIIAAAKRYADAHAKAGTDPQYIPAPDVWLNKGGYDDEDLPQPARASPTVNNASSRGGFASLWLKSNGFDNGQPSETRRADENVSEFPRLAVDERSDGGGDAGGLSGNLIELFATGSG